MQSTYWKKMTQFKYALCYFDAHMERSVRIDRGIKIFCAVASSASIAAWATWSKLAFWWGLIIVLSQIVIAINEYLPYAKRIREISNIRAALTPIYNSMEKDWHYVSNGSMTEDEINEKCYYYVEIWNKIDDGFFIKDALPQISKCKDKAEAAKESYFATNY